MRKYNEILFCDKTPNGYWNVAVRTPNGQLHRKVYIGYSKQAALRKARITDFDREAGLLFDRRSGRER